MFERNRLPPPDRLPFQRRRIAVSPFAYFGGRCLQIRPQIRAAAILLVLWVLPLFRHWLVFQLQSVSAKPPLPLSLFLQLLRVIVAPQLIQAGLLLLSTVILQLCVVLRRFYPAYVVPPLLHQLLLAVFWPHQPLWLQPPPKVVSLPHRP